MRIRKPGGRTVWITVAMVLVVLVLVAVFQPARYVASGHFTLLGVTNFAAVDVFAHSLIPKYPTVVHVRVLHHVAWFATPGNLAGRSESGFELQVTAKGRSPEAAMAEASAMTHRFRAECAARLSANHGSLSEPKPIDVRPYSTMRDAVLLRGDQWMRNHCRSVWMWGLWGRLNAEFDRLEFQRYSERVAEAEAREQAERDALEKSAPPRPLTVYE